MQLLLSLMLLLLWNILGFSMPSLLAAWLFTLALPVTFVQALWLSLGMIIAVEYIIQSITDMPGQTGFSLIELFIAVVTAFFLLALSGLFGRLLLQIINIDLTIFEATLLFAVSLVAGLFFLARAGSVGLPRWMMLSEFDEDDEDIHDDYVIHPPQKRSSRRKRRTRKR